MARSAKILRFLLHQIQATGAIAAIVLYSLNFEGVTKTSKWNFAITTGAFSLAGSMIQGPSRLCFRGDLGIVWSMLSGFCSGILFLFWTSLVGIFAKKFIHLHAANNHGIRMMQVAVYVDVGNMVIWFLTVVDMLIVFGYLLANETGNGTAAVAADNGGPMTWNGRNLSASFVPHGWNNDDIEAQTRAVETEHPTVRASIVMQEIQRTNSGLGPARVKSIATPNEKSRIVSVTEVPPLLPEELQTFWSTYSHLFGPTQECQICCEERPIWTGFPVRISKACGPHEQETCNNCIDTWIATELENNYDGPIHCAECDAVLDYEEVRSLSSPMTFARYERMGIRGFVNNDPNFVWCQNPLCDSGQEHIGGFDQPIVTCQACNFKTCFKHQMPWHEEMLCDEYDERQKNANDQNQTKKDQELASLKTIHQSTKPCANTACKAPIFKDAGCDHMRCWRCKQEFCWVCGGDWKRERHRQGCPFSK